MSESASLSLSASNSLSVSLSDSASISLSLNESNSVKPSESISSSTSELPSESNTESASLSDSQSLSESASLIDSTSNSYFESNSLPSVEYQGMALPYTGEDNGNLGLYGAILTGLGSYALLSKKRKDLNRGEEGQR